jgi:ribonuclease H2 subunit A
MDASQDTIIDEAVQEDILQEEPPVSGTFMPPSLQLSDLYAGRSYAHYSPCPPTITPAPAKPPSSPTDTSSTALPTTSPSPDPTPCVLGVDEAGRGPVLGPMVYSAFYLPLSQHHSLLTAKEHRFDDSKALTPATRSSLMRQLCTPATPLHTSCGWAVKVLSALDISAGMLRPGSGVYNLNAQAMDATVEIMRGIIEERRVDVKEVYIDTIGNPQSYQKKLERMFPTLKITVAKKADSLYPCVSAASVCAKVTRDAALEACYAEVLKERTRRGLDISEEAGWGSGYPSDGKCVAWLKSDMDALFGWGNECRFSWGTVKELLDSRNDVNVKWPVEQDEETQLMTQFFITAPVAGSDAHEKTDELRDWFGRKPKAVF